MTWRQNEQGAWEFYGEQPPTFAEPTPLQRLAVRAVAISTIIVIPLAAVFFVNRHQTNERVNDTRHAIVREGEIRRATTATNRQLAIHFNRVQEWADFDNCVADEKRDTVIVAILRSIPKDERSMQVQDAIETLEPTRGDRVCIPPRGSRPKEARP